MENVARHPKKGHKTLRALVWGAAAALLLLPWVAMQFTSEVNWTKSDFMVFGVMLLLACGSCDGVAPTNNGDPSRITSHEPVRLPSLPPVQVKESSMNRSACGGANHVHLGVSTMACGGANHVHLGVSTWLIH